ncbi:MAG: MmcQ/YjbR family DNA-binding protein, partial [Actinobacteria bacterium]
MADSAVNDQEIVDRRTIARRKARLCKIVLALPDTTVTGDQHLSLLYKKKRFGYCLDDHHGDGIVALSCKADPGVNHALVRADPLRFFIPAYVGPKGWLGLRLDLPEVEWGEVEAFVRDAYGL